MHPLDYRLHITAYAEIGFESSLESFVSLIQISLCLDYTKVSGKCLCKKKKVTKILLDIRNILNMTLVCLAALPPG